MPLALGLLIAAPDILAACQGLCPPLESAIGPFSRIQPSHCSPHALTLTVSPQKALRAALDRATMSGVSSDTLRDSAFRIRGTLQGSGKDGPFMTAHTAAAFSLAAEPDVHLVGLIPAVDTLQDYTQRDATDLTHALPRLTDAASFPYSGMLTRMKTLKKAETLKPLTLFRAAWERLPGISQWVLRTIRLGYTIQFRKGPPPFRGILPTVVKPEEVAVLRQEMTALLKKGAIEEVHPSQMESGFYSRYFVVPKKGGGLRPILDLRRLNLALRTSKFKMLTVKSILSQIQPNTWFVTIDLKDAYFHIQIIKRHRKFLRFALEGKAYQYRVLPFGLALAPRTFSKCMDAALAPLRLQGVRVLNYLDDWLVLAQSQTQALSHRDLVLNHLRSLGLCTNFQKSVLIPSQRITFLGIDLDSRAMTARLSLPRVQSLTSCVRHFKVGRTVTVSLCLRLLGLMAAASPVIRLGLLHMRPFQWWTKSQNISPRCFPHRTISVTRRCVMSIKQWMSTEFLLAGVRLGICASRETVTTDASLTGWGAVCQGRPAHGVWTATQRGWHINRLELLAVFLALQYFSNLLTGRHVLLRSDNMAVVSYLNHQGGLRSRPLCRLARSILLWSRNRFLSIRAVHVPGRLNVGADLLSRQTLEQGEWRLHPQTVSLLWRIFGEARVDLFASSTTTHCPLWFSLCPPSPLGLDALAHDWPRTSLYAFPPIRLIPAVLSRIRLDRVEQLLLVAPWWPTQPWFAELVSLIVGSPWEIPLRQDLLSQARGMIWHPRPDLWKLWAWPLSGVS